jgi:hypothetical protein
MNRKCLGTIDPGFTARRVQAGVGTVVPQSAQIDQRTPLHCSPVLANGPDDDAAPHLRARPRTATGTTVTEAALKSP